MLHKKFGYLWVADFRQKAIKNEILHCQVKDIDYIEEKEAPSMN